MLGLQQRPQAHRSEVPVHRPPVEAPPSQRRLHPPQRFGRGRSGALMVGVPDYDRYVAHMRAQHPDHEPLTREAFVRARMEARYGGKGVLKVTYAPGDRVGTQSAQVTVTTDDGKSATAQLQEGGKFTLALWDRAAEMSGPRRA